MMIIDKNIKWDNMDSLNSASTADILKKIIKMRQRIKASFRNALNFKSS